MECGTEEGKFDFVLGFSKKLWGNQSGKTLEHIGLEQDLLSFFNQYHFA